MEKIQWMIVCCLAIIVMGCHHEKTEDRIGQCADSFATLYFNWQLAHVMSYCTEESHIWVRYVASQVNETDIDTLRSKKQAAQVEITGMDYREGDSTATVYIKVSDFWEMDASDMQGKMTQEANFILQMVQREDRWKVRMEGLLQSEKRNRERSQDAR